MNDQILSYLDNDPIVNEILNDGDHVGNLFLMEEALCLSRAFQIDQKTRIIVKKNRYEAMQLYHRMENLVDCDLFVMDENLRIKSIASSPEDTFSQILALSSWIKSDKPRIVICNTAAFLRFLPDKAFFSSFCFKLSVDDEISMEELKSKLDRCGYARVNYVDRPCTLASRGGIIDIYSLNYEHPIRIEFFDTVIESIRYFDETSQRTIETINHVDIIPASDVLFTDDEIKTIFDSLDKQLEKEKNELETVDLEILLDHIEKDKLALESYDNQSDLYRYYSYVHPANILDYIQGKVILSSVEEIERAYKDLNTENIEFIQEMVSLHYYLAKFTLFHDLYQFKDTIKFHEFLDFDKPLLSNITPVEKSDLGAIRTLEDTRVENIYIAIDEESMIRLKNTLNDYPIHKKITFIDPIYYEGFQYDDMIVYTTKELFHKKRIDLKYKNTFKEGQVLENILELEINDYIVHEQYGIGQYVGIQTKNVKGRMLDYLHILYAGNNELFVPLSQFQLVRKYISKEGAGIQLSTLGSDKWKKTKAKVSKKVDEIASELVELYAKRNEDIGFAFSKDDALQREFDEAFEYEPTIDQLRATEEIKNEMQKSKPMDHLLCGDVGFGKTEVAMRACFKAITNNKQVAFLCPTTILSMQHYKTVSKRFENVGANIAVVNRFVSTADVKNIVKRLKAGDIDIIIGTHRLLNPMFEYKDLGLLIIDEEQRFGVKHKEKIKEMKNSIDVLALSATPIPRTLQMSLIGVRTISQLNTPPASRHPIQTYVMEKRSSVVKEIISRELARGGQVFYLYNRVANIYNVANEIKDMFPDVEVAVAHGKMSKDQIEKTMLDFEEEKYQILVCTTIIETGLDIANANTMIIEDADHFGLSQLYQIRGRVGRREKIAFCYLLIRQGKNITEEASKRLKAIKEFTQLGSGYKVAMRDLTIRGAGDMLGAKQAGFIDQVGLDLYLDMLAKAIKKKKGEVEESKPEKVANIALNGYVPQRFTDNDGDKLELYQRIKKCHDMNELKAYRSRIEDLFGHIPNEVEKLFEQKQLDFFVNIDGVDSLKETDDAIIITMDENFSKHCDGSYLFESIDKINHRIKLRLVRGKIQILINKKQKYMPQLLNVIDLLVEECHAIR